MKKSMFKKTSGLMAMLLIVSVLTPILAFAANIGYDELKFNRTTGKVSGVVFTTYDAAYDSVHVNVYAADGETTLAKNVYASYFKTDSVTGATYYRFEASITTNDALVRFGSYLTDSVLGVVYDATGSSVSGEWQYTGPIGGGIIGSDKVDIGADGYVDANQLRSAFNNNTVVELTLKGDFANLPASVLAEFANKEGATLKLISESTGATYTIPLNSIDYAALAEELGVSLDELIIKVGIAKATGEAAEAMQAAAKEQGIELAADLIDFTLEAVGKDGKTINITFNTYVARTINVNGTVDDKTATGVVYDPKTGEFRFVPSIFSEVDGKTIVEIFRNSNSVYTVAKLSKSFTDVPENYWAKEDIELLASKLIVKGDNDRIFAPKRNITRAEFAALVVRSLGLNELEADNTFSDVAATKWYAGSVAAAAAAGIVQGDGNGKFRPDAQVSREELAAMVVRAMKYAGKDVALTDAEVSAALADFTDASKLKWSKAEVAVAVSTGIVEGYKSNINPTDNALRAEAVAMLKRFLSNVDFI